MRISTFTRAVVVASCYGLSFQGSLANIKGVTCITYIRNLSPESKIPVRQRVELLELRQHDSNDG